MTRDTSYNPKHQHIFPLHQREMMLLHKIPTESGNLDFMNSHCISIRKSWFHEFPLHQQEMLLPFILIASAGNVAIMFSHRISRKCCFHVFPPYHQEISPLVNRLHNLTTYVNCKISLKHYNCLFSIGGTGAVELFQAPLLVQVWHLQFLKRKSYQPT